MYGDYPRKLLRLKAIDVWGLSEETVKILSNSDVRIYEFPLFSFPLLTIAFISWSSLFISMVHCCTNNDISAEIQKSVLAVNRYLHGMRKRQRSHLTSKSTKRFLYKLLIRPVLSFASGTWTLTYLLT
jgi:hypothetical protein